MSFDIKTQTSPQNILMMACQSGLILNNFENILIYTQRLENHIEQNRKIETVKELSGFDMFKLARRSKALQIGVDGDFHLRTMDDLVNFIVEIENAFISKNRLTRN